MTEPIEYVVAAAAYQHCLLKSGEFEFPKTVEDFVISLNSFYNCSIDKDIAAGVLRRLAALDFVVMRNDKYAGVIISAQQDSFDSRYLALCELKPEIFVRPMNDAWIFYSKSMNNPLLWADLSGEAIENISNIDNNIPASDRVVTLTHNSEESRTVISAIECVVDDLETNNEIASEAGESRERLVSEGKAAIELIRGEKISWLKANGLILEFLKEIAKKFSSKVADWGLDGAIQIMHKILDLLK